MTHSEVGDEFAFKQVEHDCLHLLRDLEVNFLRYGGILGITRRINTLLSPIAPIKVITDGYVN